MDPDSDENEDQSETQDESDHCNQFPGSFDVSVVFPSVFVFVFHFLPDFLFLILFLFCFSFSIFLKVDCLVAQKIAVVKYQRPLLIWTPRVCTFARWAYNPNTVCKLLKIFILLTFYLFFLFFSKKQRIEFTFSLSNRLLQMMMIVDDDTNRRCSRGCRIIRESIPKVVPGNTITS